MSRFALSLFIVGLVLIWTGACGMYEATTAGKKQTVTYEEFVRRRPRTGWYKITGAAWDMEYQRYDTVRNRRSRHITVRLPVHAAHPLPNDVLIHVIAETDRPDIQQFVNEEARSPNGPLPIPANMAHYEGDIEGTVAVFPWGVPSNKRLGGFGSPLAPNPVVIRVGKKPNAVPGFLSVLGGIVLIGTAGLFIGNRRRF